MGWFDNSDDDDDEEEGSHRLELTKESSISLADDPGGGKYRGADDEAAAADGDDPLDVYMKSLGGEDLTAVSASKAERLDVQNEEEATSHWRVSASSVDAKRKRSGAGNPNGHDGHGLDGNDHDDGGGGGGGADDDYDDDDDDDDDDAADDEDDKMKEDITNMRKRLVQEEFSSLFHKGKAKARPGSAQARGSTTPDFQHLAQVEHGSITYEDVRHEFYSTKDTIMGLEWRKDKEVSCSPSTVDPILNMEEIQDLLGPELLRVIRKMGYTTTTPVQAQTLPLALSGKDCLITASTGSGKTLAYIWPMVVHVCDQRHFNDHETGPIGVILVPTRELALQVHNQVQIMLGPLGGKSMSITGGMGGGYHLVQELKLKGGGVEIVVATPGRFLDVLSSSSFTVNNTNKKKKKFGLSLSRVTMVVLDEADKLLELGFESQVTEILKNIRPLRQSLLLSATFGRKVERVAQQWLSKTNVHRISVGRTGEASEHVQQHVLVLPSPEAKKQWLVEMLPILAEIGQTIVFVATRVDCETLANQIRTATKNSDPLLVVETLHGDKHMSDRQAALKAFSKGRLTALIATDVAARGIDTSVSSVINFDPAKNLDVHTHRVGRAGRLSSSQTKLTANEEGGVDRDTHRYEQGTAYTLLTHQNAEFAHVIRNAFEREGREITPELNALAGKSRRSGNIDSRNKWDKAGLGFHDGATPRGADGVAEFSKSSTSSLTYGPFTESVPSPSPKRRRWG